MKTIRLILLAGILSLVSCLYPGEDWGFEVAVELSLNEKTCERLVLDGSYQILKGSVEIEESGYFYSASKSNPDLNNAEKKTAILSGTGFTATIEGLTPNTTYYVRPYVRSDKSYAYGEVETFRTDATTAYTPALSNAGTSAVGVQRATVTSVLQLPNDSYPITEAGFCYSDTAELPSLNDSYVQVEPVDGSISYTFASLKPDQKYYVRAYAINALGTFYGSSMEFSTASPVSLGEVMVSNLSSTGFNVTAGLQTPYISEGFTLVESGFCYSGETSLPTVSHLTVNSTVSNEQISATVLFGSKISYFVRAYAKCSNGEYYYGKALKVGDKSFTVQGISFDMVAVNGGSFSMGATDEQLRSAGAGEMKPAPSFDSRKTINFETQLASITQDHSLALRSVRDNEKPVHTVSLSPYYIGKHEVTQQLWQAVMGYNNSGYDNSDQNPVENISWYECLVFIDKLKALTGAAFVLPTEAQWEYAARGGALHEAYKYAGSELCDTVAWTKENSSGTPHVVGSRQANALGIYDMSGNISEKCYDWYAPDYYSNSHQTDPSGPAVGTHRVQRGGDYYNEADWARVSSRSWIHADSCYLNYGFRLALREGMTLPEVDKVVVGEMTVSGNTSLPVKASFRVTVNSRGSGQVSEKGICISSSESPDLAGTHYHLDTIADNYEIDLYMKEDRSFYVRSYAISEAGVVYGEQVAFTTPKMPVVSTVAVTDITASSATCGGTVSDDGGLEIMARGVVWSTSSNPTIDLNTKTSDGTGPGSFISQLTDLTSGTDYYVRAYATNAIGTTYGEQLSFSTLHIRFNDNIDYGTLTDVDGNTYKTVTIGSQTWMAENLRTTKYNDGTTISNVTSDNSWGGLSTGAWCHYNNYSAYDQVYGKLYNWYAVGTGKLCPSGWHVPSISEWEVLTDNNLHLKEIGSGHWSYSSGITDQVTNESGFTALPGGYRDDIGGDFGGMGSSAYWWSTSTYLSFWAYYCSMFSSSTSVYCASDESKEYGYSVRCLKNESPSLLTPTLTTNSVVSITPTTAESGGNISSDGGATVSARGVCWSTAPNPTTADNKTSDGAGTGEFNSTLTNLSPGTNYYLRAYATNSVGTAYGNSISFKTLDFEEPDMIFVKGGTFTMGATSEQGSDAFSDEKPTHSVTLSDFYIGEYEVAQAQWEAVMGNNPSYFTGDPDYPVEGVSWNDVQEYITKLNQLTGKSYRLPTEAEWEYAARGGAESKGYKYSGSDTLSNVAWYYDNDNSKTHPVGTKNPNELGIYDMSGNVWEWCNDWYASDYYNNSPQTNPQGPSLGSTRVFRGGGRGNYARYCRVSNRGDGQADYRFFNLGFRLVLVP